MRVVAPDPAGIRAAAKALSTGALVVFPTETVYGIAAAADNESALERLRKVKNRPDEKHFTVHAGSVEDVERLAGRLEAPAAALAARYWPGALTMVLDVGDTTVGFRVPDCEIARDILRRASVTVVATSANRSGSAPLSTGAEAAGLLDGPEDIVVDAGRLPERKASTVVAVSGGTLRILRAGELDAAELEATAGLS